jgi:hypothetical protein
MDNYWKKRSQRLGIITIVPVVVVVLAGLLCHGYHEYYPVRGGEIGGFGWFTTFNEETHSRYDAARTALGVWLESNGFAKVPKPSNYNDTGADVTWYKGSECFHVKVKHPAHSQGNGCGLEANVWWYTRGFSWNLDEQERKIRKLTPVLAAWWQDYRRDNPWWGWSDDGKECCRPRNGKNIPQGDRKGN